MVLLTFYSSLQASRAQKTGTKAKASMHCQCRYTHPQGRGGFASVDHGQKFREAAYKEAGLAQPSPWKLGGAPRTITLLSAVTGEMVGLLFCCSSVVDNRGALKIGISSC